MALKIKAGKSYNINHPNGKMSDKPGKVYIDHILPNKNYSGEFYQLVVYRIWIKHKRYWKNYIEPYYAIAMWNEWPHK